MSFSSLRTMIQTARLRFLVSALLIIAAMLIPAVVVRADGASLYLSADDGTLDVNQITTVSVRVDPAGQDVDGVEAHLGYNAGHFEFLSIDAAGSAFSVELGPQSGGNGSVQIIRGSFTPVTGDALVANVKFKALQESGDSIILFGDGSNATGSGAYLNPEKVEAYFIFVTAEPPPEEIENTPTQPGTSATGNGTGTGVNQGSGTGNSSAGGNSGSNSGNASDTEVIGSTTEVSKPTATPISSNSFIRKLPMSSFITRNSKYILIAGSALVVIFGALYARGLFLHYRMLHPPPAHAQGSAPPATVFHPQQPDEHNPPNSDVQQQ